MAIVPVTLHPDNVPSQYASDYKAYTENAENVPVIDKTSMMQFYELTGVDPKDKSYFTALDEENLANFPPTYIATCEFDPLRDDGKIMGKALSAKGVKIKEDYYEGLPHVSFFPMFSIPFTLLVFGNSNSELTMPFFYLN